MKRLLVLVFLFAMLGTAFSHARSIPDPRQRPAPGNEFQQAPLAEARYSPAVNYQLQCAGCHLSNGQGSPKHDIPNMQDFVGHFLKVEGGRNFLVQVPGVAQSALNDEQIADLLNWILRSEEIAGTSASENMRLFTKEEVEKIRDVRLKNLPGFRATLIERMHKKGLDINDGMAKLNEHANAKHQ